MTRKETRKLFAVCPCGKAYLRTFGEHCPWCVPLASIEFVIKQIDKKVKK